MSLIGQPIQHRFTESGVAKDLRPLGKLQVGGHDDGRLFRPFSDDLKEQFGSDRAGSAQAAMPAGPLTRKIKYSGVSKSPTLTRHRCDRLLGTVKLIIGDIL